MPVGDGVCGKIAHLRPRQQRVDIGDLKNDLAED